MNIRALFIIFIYEVLISSNLLYCMLPTFFTIQTNTITQAYGYYMPYPTPNIIREHGWDYFHRSCFSITIMLEKARVEQCPFVLVVPNNLNGYSPIAFEAPIIEGARTALTWSSAYFKFKELGNVDIRILMIPEEMAHQDDKIKTCINNILVQNMPDASANASPEHRIKQRIMHATTTVEIDIKNTIKFIPFDMPTIEKEKLAIRPILKNYPTKKRIIITGASGFIGSHLARALLRKNYQVICLDNLSCSTTNNLNDLQENPDFEFYTIDITHPFDIEGPVDIIIHLASIPSPAFYYKMPVETLMAGLHGTKVLLELAQQKNARFVFASSSEVYGNPEVNPQSEYYPGLVDPLGKRSQYDQSKRGAETLLKLYFDAYHLDIRIGRIFNTFGPGMQLGDGRVITNFISAALKNEPLIIYGDGNQTRSPAYISDTVEGLMRITELDIINSFTSINQRIFNIGNHEEFSINQIAICINNITKKHLSKTVSIKHIPQFDETDPKLRRPNLSYIHAITGFKPTISFEEGLEKTFLHYLKFTDSLK